MVDETSCRIDEDSLRRQPCHCGFGCTNRARRCFAGPQSTFCTGKYRPDCHGIPHGAALSWYHQGHSWIRPLSAESGGLGIHRCKLLQQRQIEQLDAFRVMYEYHVDRAVGLIIPTWIWRLKRKELNRIWATLRASSTSETSCADQK